MSSIFCCNTFFSFPSGNLNFLTFWNTGNFLPWLGTPQLSLRHFSASFDVFSPCEPSSPPSWNGRTTDYLSTFLQQIILVEKLIQGWFLWPVCIHLLSFFSLRKASLSSRDLPFPPSRPLLMKWFSTETHAPGSIQKRIQKKFAWPRGSWAEQ